MDYNDGGLWDGNPVEACHRGQIFLWTIELKKHTQKITYLLMISQFWMRREVASGRNFRFPFFEDFHGSPSDDETYRWAPTPYRAPEVGNLGRERKIT